MTVPRAAEDAVEDCVALGVPRVWVDPDSATSLDPRKLATYRRGGMVVVTTVSPLARMTRRGGGAGRRARLTWFTDHLALRRSSR